MLVMVQCQSVAAWLEQERQESECQAVLEVWEQERQAVAVLEALGQEKRCWLTGRRQFLRNDYFHPLDF